MRMNESCDHEFIGGLCTRCLCPETNEDEQRAINAMHNLEAIEERYHPIIGRYLDRDSAIFVAWQSHRKS